MIKLIAIILCFMNVVAQEHQGHSVETAIYSAALLVILAIPSKTKSE